MSITLYSEKGRVYTVQTLISPKIGDQTHKGCPLLLMVMLARLADRLDNKRGEMMPNVIIHNELPPAYAGGVL